MPRHLKSILINQDQRKYLKKLQALIFSFYPVIIFSPVLKILFSIFQDLT